MSEMHVRVYDPPMCCPTGACGPDPDPELARLTRDLRWLEKQYGVVVERYNLGQQPAEFVKDPEVMELLSAQDVACLPAVFVGDELVATGAYPTREELLTRLGLADDDC